MGANTCPNFGKFCGYEKECLACYTELSQPTKDRVPGPDLEPDDWDW